MERIEAIEMSKWKVIVITVFIFGAILFFRWLFHRIEGMENKEEKTKGQSYLGENILRAFVLIVYLVGLVISEDKQHSSILTFSALGLSWLISRLYDKRRKEDEEWDLREERRAQGIYDDREEEKVSESFFGNKD